MIPSTSVLTDSQIVLYEASDGQTHVDVRLEDETVWLNLNQIADLFDRDKSVISRHIRNIFTTKELDHSTVANYATVQKEGGKDVKRSIEYYNLDMILSVGYRVNSRRGTQFRIWATGILRQHLIQGYTLHEKRLAERGLKDLEQAIALVRQASSLPELSGDQAKGLLKVITGYSQTWLLLHQYDEGSIPTGKLRPARRRLAYEEAEVAIGELARSLRRLREASELFGSDPRKALQGILGNIEQTFDGKELYPTVEEKATHLLYFIIKDHPFVDGNKRIAVLLFLLFLDKNGALAQETFGTATLVALALLIAESRPQQKDVMLQIILRFLAPAPL